MPTAATVHDNRAEHRYEAVVEEDRRAGFLDYQETAELVVLTHTDVDPAFEGQGVGSLLARSSLDDIRARGLKALVVCPFVLGWVRRHPDYTDVLFNAPKPRVSEQEQQA